MKREGGYRKANYAAYVKINMPAWAGTKIAKKPKEMHFLIKVTREWRKKILDNVWGWNIIVFTYIAACSRVPHARKRCQVRHPAATRNSKSAAPPFWRCSSYCSWAACSARSLLFQSASRESATRRFVGSNVINNRTFQD
jgi:hypothetical protein